MDFVIDNKSRRPGSVILDIRLKIFTEAVSPTTIFFYKIWKMKLQFMIRLSSIFSRIKFTAQDLSTLGPVKFIFKKNLLKLSPFCFLEIWRKICLTNNQLKLYLFLDDPWFIYILIKSMIWWNVFGFFVFLDEFVFLYYIILYFYIIAWEFLLY